MIKHRAKNQKKLMTHSREKCRTDRQINRQTGRLATLILQSSQQDGGPIGKYNKGCPFLLSVIDIFSKYVWAAPLEDKTGFIITNAFQIVLDEFKRKTNKIWVDKGLATTTAATIADLANTAVLKVVENIVSNLNRKTIYDAKISDIEAK